MKLPVVSILIPTYNHERFIGHAIESALAQSDDYPAELLDIVLVDDGSTDATPEIVARYADRIRAIRKPNGGTLSTVDRLLQEARGELSCCLSGDDAWLPGKIRRQAEVFARRPWVSLVYGDSAIIDERGAVQHPSYYGQHPALPRAIGDIRGPLLEQNFVCAPTTIWRTSLHDRFRPFEPPVVWEDWWMWINAAEQGETLYVPTADVLYRVHGGNASAGLDALAQTRYIARELPFRRWLLHGLDHTGIPYGDVLRAFQAFEWHVQECAAAGVGSPGELVPVGPVELEAAREHLRRAAEETDPAARVRLLLRALACDPGAHAARADLGAALALAALSLPPLDVRNRVIAAQASELAREPDLLAAYAEAFGEHDDVTLLVDARGWSLQRIEDELVPAAAAAGLGDGGADVLVDHAARPWPRERLAGVLTVEPGTALVAGAPQLVDTAALRDLHVRPAA